MNLELAIAWINTAIGCYQECIKKLQEEKARIKEM
jgi:hypothetical protein|tara:strand:- start:309 stop:413 length:105 start_codon:yes stop_codon:yes gene_type:complete